jgi:hypothetical protein
MTPNEDRMAAGSSAEEERPRRKRWQWLRDAFSMDSFNEPFTESETAHLEKIARFFVRRRMSVPAILFLETGKPLNYIGSQAMAFFEPAVRSLFSADQYIELRRILERRQSVETLIQLIEKFESERT